MFYISRGLFTLPLLRQATLRGPFPRSCHHLQKIAENKTFTQGILLCKINSFQTKKKMNHAAPPRVVILGAGYAGGLIARELEADSKAGRILVTVVERRDAVHHKIGAIRASVRAGEWTDRSRIPLNRVVKHARTVIGDVAAIDADAKVLRFRDPDQPVLAFDILVAATGSLNHSPGDLPPTVSGKDECRAYFRNIAKAIEEAKDVLIVGGGASAIEYAGEIRDAYPDKPVTIVSSSPNMLSSSVAPVSSKFLIALYKTMEERKIKLIRGEKVVKPSEVDFSQRKFMKGPLTIQTVGAQNLEIKTDLLLWAATWSINAGIYPSEWINEVGELNIRSTFQVVDRDDVFALGDVCSLAETKQAITLPAKMKLIRNNIVKVADAMQSGKFSQGQTIKGLKSYRVVDKVTMYLPIGRDFGCSQIGSYVYGNQKTSKFKGKDLYTEHFWKLLTGSSAPIVFDE